MPDDDFDDRLKRAEKIAAVVGLYDAPELQLAVYRDLMAQTPKTPGIPEREQAPKHTPVLDSGVEATNADTSAPALSDDQLFIKFSKESTVPVPDLETVFYFDSTGPHLNGPKSKLGKNSAEQSRAVALAITAAYDYALDERPISVEKVRAECDRLKCSDDKNWAKNMSALTAVLYGGAARKKTLKTKSETAEALKSLVNSIRGAQSAE